MIVMDTTPTQQAYKPHSITITFETEMEAKAFYALFNGCSKVTQATEVLNAGGIDRAAIREAMRKGNPELYGVDASDVLKEGR